MGRALVIAVALGALAAGSPSAAGAEETSAPVLSRIVSSGTLRVGMTGSQPPLNFESAGGELMGLEVDLARTLARVMDLELRLVKKPFAELLAALEAGEVDLVLSGMTITPSRSLRAPFVGPYYLSGKSILTKSATLAQIDRAGELNQADLKLAALAGSTSERFVQRRMPKASLVTTSDYDAAVALLLEGEVSAVVADREIVQLTAFRNPQAGLATLREPLTIEPIGIAVAPGDARLVRLLESTLDSLEASGLLTAIRVRWLERSDWLDELP